MTTPLREELGEIISQAIEYGIMQEHGLLDLQYRREVSKEEVVSIYVKDLEALVTRREREAVRKMLDSMLAEASEEDYGLPGDYLAMINRKLAALQGQGEVCQHEWKQEHLGPFGEGGKWHVCIKCGEKHDWSGRLDEFEPTNQRQGGGE